MGVFVVPVRGIGLRSSVLAGDKIIRIFIPLGVVVPPSPLPFSVVTTVTTCDPSLLLRPIVLVVDAAGVAAFRFGILPRIGHTRQQARFWAWRKSLNVCSSLIPVLPDLLSSSAKHHECWSWCIYRTGDAFLSERTS